MIPRRFFWFFDLLFLGSTFVTAYALFPFIYFEFSLMPAKVGWLIPILERLSVPDVVITFFTLVRNPNVSLPPLHDLLWILFSVIPVTVLFVEMLGGYGTRLLLQSRTRLVITSLLAQFSGLGLVLLFIFAFKVPDISRVFVFSFTFFSALSLAAYRLVVRQYFISRRAAGHYARNVVVVGLPLSVQWMSQYLLKNVSPADHHLIGYLETCNRTCAACPLSGGCAKVDLNGLERMGYVDELGDLFIHRPIHEVIAVQPSTDSEWIKEVIRQCDYFNILLRIVPEVLLSAEHKELKKLYPHEPLHLPAVVLAPRRWDDNSEALFFKRLFDGAASGVALILLAPLFLLVAIAIKLTTPHLTVFYPWKVVGRNGVEFTGYKFSTMVSDADEQKEKLADKNEMSGPVFKIKNDPRVTPLGRILRKFSINELPQLWSVFKGDMSLVGPRPAFRHELERYEFWHKRKLSIRPGITCLWQIRGRNKISDFDDWVRMDLEYIDNWSLLLDFRILVRTVWVVIAGTGS